MLISKQEQNYSEGSLLLQRHIIIFHALNCFQKYSFPTEPNDTVLETFFNGVPTRSDNVYYSDYDELLDVVNLKPEYRDFLLNFISYSDKSPAVEISAIRSLVGYLSALTEFRNKF